MWSAGFWPGGQPAVTLHFPHADLLNPAGWKYDAFLFSMGFQEAVTHTFNAATTIG